MPHQHSRAIIVLLFIAFLSTCASATEPIFYQSFDRPVDALERAAGAVGQAARFDGIDDRLRIGSFGLKRQITIAFWMNPAEDSTADDKRFRGLVTSDDWAPGVLHIAMRGRFVEPTLHLGGTNRAILRSGNLAPDTWHHIALTIDAEQKTMRLFVNGVMFGETGFSGVEQINLDNQIIGAEQVNTHGRFFAGAIDEVRLYDTVLSDVEIRALCPDALPGKMLDPRYVKLGTILPDEDYCDQPYIVVLPGGRWLCTMTTGPGHEGNRGQHVVATWSEDQGQTWSELADIEPLTEREASWVVPLVTKFGRVYAFYTFNTQNIRDLKDKPMWRCDTMGDYCYRYSDDGGDTWSERFTLPMRKTACDFRNEWGGEHIHFWGICKPQVDGDDAFFTFTKLERFLLINGEGWMFHSDNILNERDVTKLRWTMLPEGDGRGIKHPDFGPVQEEHNIVTLDDGTIYCIYRTMSGFACVSVSRDRGKTFSVPEKLRYTPGGRIVKTPRACPKVWKCKNGKYLLWIKNHSRPSYQTRNPVWLVGGVEQHGTIHWSEPEIVLFEDNPTIGMSYPDLIEEDGRYWIVETQKYFARIHEIDAMLLEGLWTQGDRKSVTRDGLVVEADAATLATGTVKLPNLSFGKRASAGLTVDFWLDSARLDPGQTLLDSRDANGHGLFAVVAEDMTVQLTLAGKRASMTWDTDPGWFDDRKRHHVVAIIDANPRIIMFVIDGQVCDGGEHRCYGWRSADGMAISEQTVGKNAIQAGWDFDLAAMPNNVTGNGNLKVAPAVASLRIYNRYLRTSEAIGNYYAEAE